MESATVGVQLYVALVVDGPRHGGDAALTRWSALASGGDPECSGGSVQRGMGAVQRAHDAAVEGLQRSALDVRASAESYRTAVGADSALICDGPGDIGDRAGITGVDACGGNG